MEKRKTRYPLWMLIALGAAVVVFLISAVGGTRAALNIESEGYVTEFEMYHIGITLNENKEKVAPTGKLLSALTDYEYGTKYPEVLTVTNSGAIDEYVRVTVYKYWTDADGNKLRDLDPDYIELNFLTGDKWIVDEEYSKDPERTVLYYKDILAPGETSDPFTDTILINGEIKKFVSRTEAKDEETGYTVVTNTYTYNGKLFCVEVQADGVQTHNAEDAVLSAWGRKVSISDGTLSLG